MKVDDSDQINEIFRSVVRDWTPSPARDAARMLFAPAFFDKEFSRRCSSVLSDRELKRADKFLTEDKRNHFIQRRAFRRFCAVAALESTAIPLSRIDFEETEEGRPYLSAAPAIWFSFSSCNLGFVGAWSFTHGLGVDIESRTQELEMEALAQQFFSETESRIVADADDRERAQMFFRLWTLKESALKSIGKGLPFGLDEFGFDLTPNLRVRRAPDEYGGPGSFEPHLIAGNQTFAALVTHLH